MHKTTSIRTLFLLLLTHFTLGVWSSASLIPPTPSPDPTVTIQTSTGPLSTTGTNTKTLTGTGTGVAPTGTGTNATTTSGTPTNTAQLPSLSDVPSCVSNCLTTGLARVGCTTIAEPHCYCVQPNFPAEVVACVLASCPDQVTPSEQLAQQFCDVASSSPSLTFPPVPTTTMPAPTSDSTSTSATSTAPATSTTSSGALARGKGTVVGVAIGGLLGAFVGL